MKKSRKITLGLVTLTAAALLGGCEREQKSQSDPMVNKATDRPTSGTLTTRTAMPIYHSYPWWMFWRTTGYYYPNGTRYYPAGVPNPSSSGLGFMGHSAGGSGARSSFSGSISRGGFGGTAHGSVGA